ncbi:39S ribosomal protein L4, mitochondrial [Nilaparvata lugens]|uniref:39S ribosomal protein L4, mitochondrial n=1 Tax=Nilaparvata lugens TaxID=108931 RepID=UPI000B98DC99|nr:39S ribosomal protein L4, mitochondrial [Nilaparvata lugens]
MIVQSRITRLLSALKPALSKNLRCITTEANENHSLEQSQIEDAATALNDSERQLPLITNRNLEFLPKFETPRQAWVENLDTVEEQKLGLIDLHPNVFGVMPRLDIIYENMQWQQKYRRVDYYSLRTRAEMPGGGRKPWPQKGLGRARHGSIRSPLFKGGGVAHGPRSPTTYFYMLPFYKRVLGLTTTLSVKLAQDDIHIVDSLEIPTEDPRYLEDLVSERAWGVSVLFVDSVDIMPRNITAATCEIGHMNMMPVYGLNVYSMLKHEALVLTVSAVEEIEKKIIYNLNRTDAAKKCQRFMLNQV